MKWRFVIQLTMAIFPGLVIAWIDSRKNWDDTGISVFMILAVSFLFGYLSSQKPWLIALAVSIWIPLFGIIISQNYGSLLAFIPGFIGAYMGVFIKKGFLTGRQNSNSIK